MARILSFTRGTKCLLTVPVLLFIAWGLVNYFRPLNFSPELLKTFTDDSFLKSWAFPKNITHSVGLAEEQDAEAGQDVTGCQIPVLKTDDPSILSLVQGQLKPLECETPRFPLLFNASVMPTPQLIPVKTAEEMNILNIDSCCMRQVYRANDFVSAVHEQCKRISLRHPTQVPADWDYLSIDCSGKDKMWGTTMDLHSFIPWDNQTKFQEDRASSPPALNVMIIVIDALSRLNFIRTMPEAEGFLRNNMNALVFKSFTKVGENTFPNMAALLTGQVAKGPYEKTKLDCEKSTGNLNNCPFVWKEFEAAGYRTMYADDSIGMAPFNLEHKGFSKQPTNYYMRPMVTAFGDLHVAHEARSLSAMCFGPRPAYQVTLDYLAKMTEVMTRTKTPFFQLAIIGSVTHEFYNGGRLMDVGMLRFLEKMQRNGIWNTTALFVLSDHGNRLVNYYQTFVEDRLPIMYVTLPPWFSKVYPKAYQNIQQNKKQLATMFDIHRTLQDLLWVNQIEDAALKKRSTNITSTKPGISLFLPLPLSRTCTDAGVPDNYCVCNLKATSVSPDHVLVRKVVEKAVSHINEQLMSLTDAPCAPFVQERISEAHLFSYDFPGQPNAAKRKNKEIYRIVMETRPGPAIFEVMVFSHRNTSSAEVVGYWTLGRSNMYEKDSGCVKDNPSVKPFCVCKKY